MLLRILILKVAMLAISFSCIAHPKYRKQKSNVSNINEQAVTSQYFTYFGNINVQHEKNYIATTIIGSNQVSIKINFNGQKISIESIKSTDSFLKNLDSINNVVLNRLKNENLNTEFEDVNTYVEHHLEYLDKDEISDITKSTLDIYDAKARLKDALKLIWVDIYPDNDTKNQFALFEYSIGVEYTQYKIVCTIDFKGNVKSVSMES